MYSAQVEPLARASMSDLKVRDVVALYFDIEVEPVESRTDGCLPSLRVLEVALIVCNMMLKFDDVEGRRDGRVCVG